MGKGSRRVYSFEDLVELRVIAKLRTVGIPLPTVRKAVRYVRQHFVNLVRPLSRLALMVDGKSILIRTTDDKRLIDATREGQMVISFAVAPIAKELKGKVTQLGAPRDLKIRVAGQTFLAVLTPDLAAGGYSIEVPELPGVVTEADSIQEARRMTADAIRLWRSVASHDARRQSK